MKNTEITNINVDDNELQKGKDFFCEHFCSTKYDLHIHRKKDYDSYKGIKMKEVTQKFQVETMKFVNIFICEVCEFKSCGIDDHHQHFEDKHANVDYEQVCLFNTCDFTSLYPEELIKHFSENHDKSISNILKMLVQKQ